MLVSVVLLPPDLVAVPVEDPVFLAVPELPEPLDSSSFSSSLLSPVAVELALAVVREALELSPVRLAELSSTSDERDDEPRLEEEESSS